MMVCTETREIVRTIIALGHNLELDIVAEGVESREQQELLFQLGCTHAQGYLYARPMPSDSVVGFLRSFQPQPANLWLVRTPEQINAELDQTAQLLSGNN